MRRIVFVLALLTANPSYAAEIICYESNPCGHVTYEHLFELDDALTMPENPSLWSIYNPVPTPFDTWTIPSFDPSLGIPEVLLIDIEATVTLSGRIDDLAGQPEVRLSAIISTLSLLTAGGPNAFGGGGVRCTEAPCDFSLPGWYSDSTWVLPSSNNIGWEVPWWDVNGYPDTVLTLPLLPWSPDTFFRLYDPNGELMAAPITLRTEVSGIARATYLYEPTAVPEPTTFLLIGSGLLGAEWKRRRIQHQK